MPEKTDLLQRKQETTLWSLGQKQKVKKYSLIIWIITIICFIAVANGIYFDIALLGFAAFPFIILIVFILFFMNKKYYNNFIYLIAFFIIGIIFKRNHWPLSGFIMAITSMVSIVGFVIISIHTLITIKDNKFLKYFGFIINIILALSFMGLLFKLMHWPGGDFFAYSGTIAFLISVMSLTFTLPNANYIEWTKFHKKLFYKAIIIPMVFVFIITSLTTVFPKTWDNIFFSGSKHAWNMKNIDLFEKEGLD